MKKISLLLALCMLVTAMLTACSDKYASSEADDYQEYLELVLNSKSFMPVLDDLGEYTSFEATYKHSRTAILYQLDTVGLFVTYEDADEFEYCLEELESDYRFFEDYPDEGETDYLCEAGGYSIRMVDAEYELEVYKSAMLIGVDEEKQKICYLFYYDPDMDVLGDLDGYVKEHFYLR
ncbi:MAG: hypothetical protein E7647_04445 [Ruminococcaceae bacterium]|nr:hypothetical protein [Oscillospiraceae bacterium]